ncbi:MAG: DUF4397 domain-containing protein [Anaerolineae bacterium]|nr:DUF4397 domain-containing protein [Anaerolineae bacterium]
MPKLKPIVVLLGVLLVVGALAACQPQPTPAPTPEPLPTETLAPTNTSEPPTPIPTLPRVSDPVTSLDPSKRANVRFIVAVANAAPVDVYVDGKLLSNRLLFGRLTSPQPLPPGDHTITVREAGKPESAPLAETLTTLDEAESAFVLLTGLDEVTTIEVYNEDLTSVGDGYARVSFLFFAPNGGDTITYSIGAVADQYTSPGNDSVTQVTPPDLLTMGQYTVSATHDDKSSAQDINLQDHRSYVFIVLIGADGTPLIVRNITPTRRETNVRVIHAGTGLPAYDVYLNDQLVAPAINFRGATEWQKLEPRSYEVRLLAAGDSASGTPILRRQFTLNPDSANDIIIFDGTNPSLGADAAPTPSITVLRDDISVVAPGKARLTFLHLARIKEAVFAVQPGSNFMDLPSIQAGKTSAALEVPAASYSIAFLTRASDGTETTIEAPQPFDLMAGNSYLYIITGVEKEPPPFLISTAVGEGTIYSTPTPIPSEVLKIRILNTLTDGSALDLYLGDTVLFSNVSAATVSEYAPVVTDDRTLRVVKAGTQEQIATAELRYQPNVLFTLIAYGDGSSAQIITAQDAPTKISTATLRLIYALPGGPQVSVFAARRNERALPTTTTPEPDRLLESINAPGVSATTEMGPGTYYVLVRSDADRTAIAELASVELKAGVRYDVLLVPAAAGSTEAKAVVLESAN